MKTKAAKKPVAKTPAPKSAPKATKKEPTAREIIPADAKADRRHEGEPAPRRARRQGVRAVLEGQDRRRIPGAVQGAGR